MASTAKRRKPRILRQAPPQIRRGSLPRKARALTVAGSDSGGGAGMQADLKTFAALGVYGMSALTALTAQNTRGVLAVHPVPPDFVRAQIDAVANDIGFDAAKTGMLANEEIVSTVADAMRAYRVRRLVVDPVMHAASGDRLLAPEAERVIVERLLPLAFVATPNAFEAAALSGIEVKTTADQEEAARRIAKLGPRAVLVKGGRTAGPSSVDVLYERGRITRLGAKRISFSFLRQNLYDLGDLHLGSKMLITAGRVVDSKGRPVAGAVVTARDVYGASRRGNSNVSGEFFACRTTTDEQGRFRLRAPIVDNTRGMPALLQDILDGFGAADQVTMTTLVSEPNSYRIRLRKLYSGGQAYHKDYKLAAPWKGKVNKREIIKQLNGIGEDFVSSAEAARKNGIYTAPSAMVPGKKLGKTGMTSDCEPVSPLAIASRRIRSRPVRLLSRPYQRLNLRAPPGTAIARPSFGEAGSTTTSNGSPATSGTATGC